LQMDFKKIITQIKTQFSFLYQYWFYLYLSNLYSASLIAYLQLPVTSVGWENIYICIL
jgi:hypothetical protein